jgi:hypothetical protein
MIKTKTNSIFEKLKGAIFAFTEKGYRKNLYCSIDDERLSMRKYVAVVCDDNLKALKKYPIFVPETVMAKVWQELILQYAEKTKNKDVKARIDRNEKMQNTYNRLNILRGCHMALSIVPDEERIIKFLSDSGIRAVDSKSLLKRVESEMKTLALRIKDLSALNRINAQDEYKKPTRDDYQLVFVRLKKDGYDAGYDMSVLEFILAKNQHEQEIEEANRRIEQLKAKKNGKL